MNFVHLHNHSYYSLLQSPTSPAVIAKTAKKQGCSAVALTDNGVMYGALEFYQACKKEDIKAILGLEVLISPRSMYQKEIKSDGRPWNLVLLAENQEGYENLIQISSLAHMEGFYYKPRVDVEALKKYSKGLIALSGGFQGEIAQSILEGDDEEKITTTILKYKDLFDEGNFFLEVSYHPALSGQLELNEAIFEYGEKLNIPVVVAQNAYYAEVEEAEAQDILTCIATNRTVDDDRRTMIDEDYSMIDPEEIISVFSNRPEVIENTQKIADRCNVEFDLGKYCIPEIYPPEEHTTNDPISFFRFECIAGLKFRYPQFAEHLEKISWSDMAKNTVNNTEIFDKPFFQEIIGENQTGENIAKRFEFEFLVIKNMGFESYFLIVWDYIKWAKEEGIIVGPGRGSGAGSIIAYALQITNIEPLMFDLLFERFLNPDRISMPDFDIDFQDNRREEVIRYVTDKYGADKVAQISTFGTLAARAAVKDVGRALGISFQEMNDFAKLIPDRPGTKLQEAWDEEPDLRDAVESSPIFEKMWGIARRLEGCVRHVSVHACAVVISKDPLYKYSAVQHPPKDTNRTITQFSSGPLESLGLLKMDFLGLKNLTILDRALRIIERIHGVTIDIDTIPLDDESTYKLFQKGQTTGIFQFESNGMKRYLKDLKPTVFDDVLAMVALYRPGPLNSGMTDSFVARKHGKEEITYPHPCMESVLKDTYGVVVYQEQIMNLSKIMANFTGGQADTLRKAMGKKIKELMDKLKEEFIVGCASNDISKKIAEEVWNGWEEFAKYGFNKSHSACYALIAYQTAYLKSRYPTEFMAALMTSDKHNTERIALEIDECRQMGIEILPPSVNSSMKDFTVIEDGYIRFGLSAIKNLGESGIEAIVTARGPENTAFIGIEEFISTVEVTQLNRKNLEALIKSGAMDDFGGRASQVASMEAMIEFAKEKTAQSSSGQIGLFDMGEVDTASSLHFTLTFAKKAKLMELLSWERDLLGLFVSTHPLAGLEKYLEQKYFSTKDITVQKIDTVQKFFGMVSDLRIIRTKKDDKMCIFTLQDAFGKIPVIMFPKTYDEMGKKVKEDGFIMINGKIGMRGNEIQIIPEKIYKRDIEEMREEAKRFGLLDEDKKHIDERPLPNITAEDREDELREPWLVDVAATAKKEDLQLLKGLFEKNPGKDEIIFLFPNRKQVKFPGTVKLTKLLKGQVLQILGQKL